MGPRRLGATAGFFAYALRKGGMRTHYLSEVVEVADGDVLPLPGDPVVIGMPGHSPGSIARARALRRRGLRRRCPHDAARAHRASRAPAGAVHRRAVGGAGVARSSGGVDAEWVLPGHGGAMAAAGPADVAAAVRAGAQC